MAASFLRNQRVHGHTKMQLLTISILLSTKRILLKQQASKRLITLSEIPMSLLRRRRPTIRIWHSSSRRVKCHPNSNSNGSSIRILRVNFELLRQLSSSNNKLTHQRKARIPQVGLLLKTRLGRITHLRLGHERTRSIKWTSYRRQ
jgi:hypothetical protein